MGVPVSKLINFEEKVRHSRNKWVIVILANEYSYSRAAEYVIHNFHIMDRVSGEVDFYMPGYYSKAPLCKLFWDDDICEDFSRKYSDGYIGFRIEEFKSFIRQLRSLHPDPFDSYEKYIDERCSLVLVPLESGKPMYKWLRVFDLDCILSCGNSVDSFLYTLFDCIKSDDIWRVQSEYERYTTRFDAGGRNDRVSSIIGDIERCIRWSLQEEFYFISYSSRNIMLAQYLKQKLNECKKRVWIAPDCIPQGREYGLVIPTVLKFAKTFVLLLTRDSAESHWVKTELDIAINNGVKIKIVLAGGYTLDDMKNDVELCFYLNRIQVQYHLETFESPISLAAFLEE